MHNNQITKAINLIGLANLARLCGVRYQSVQKWEKNGLPQSEWTGKTKYSEVIQKATNRKITKKMLLNNVNR